MARRRLPSGELEQQVLTTLWSTSEAMTSGEVHAIVAKHRNLAYTTVMTILTRLWEKGELTRHKRGRSYAYQPVLGRDEHVAKRMREVLGAASDHTAALNTFATALPDKQRQALRQALDAGEHDE